MYNIYNFITLRISWCKRQKRAQSEKHKADGRNGIRRECLIRLDKKIRKRSARTGPRSIWQWSDVPFEVHLSRDSKSVISFPLHFRIHKFSNSVRKKNANAIIAFSKIAISKANRKSEYFTRLQHAVNANI